MTRKLLQSFGDKRIHYVDVWTIKSRHGGDGSELN